MKRAVQTVGSRASLRRVRSLSVLSTPRGLQAFPSLCLTRPSVCATANKIRSQFSVCTHAIRHSSSSASATPPDALHPDGPFGDLFETEGSSSGDNIGPHLVGLSGQIQRTFGPRDNAQAMLVTGGPALAAHASFDPDYHRAQNWIRQHAVGPAALSSPVLVSGLIGALVEAAFPQAVPLRQSMQQVRPLIVGVSVMAQIRVERVVSTARPFVDDDDNHVDRNAEQDQQQRRYGYEVSLNTKVLRVRDDAVIARGEHVVWIPDYLRM